MKHKIAQVGFLISGAMIAATPAFAANSPINSVDDIINVFNKILGYFQTVFWIAVIASVFYGAFLFLTSSGDDKKLEKAKKQLMYSIIAIAIGLIAFGLVPLVTNILTPSK